MADRFADNQGLADPGATADQPGGGGRDTASAADDHAQDWDRPGPWNQDKRYREFSGEAKAWKEFKTAGGSIEQFNKFKDEVARFKDEVAQFERGDHPKLAGRSKADIDNRDQQWKQDLVDLGLWDIIRATAESKKGGKQADPGARREPEQPERKYLTREEAEQVATEKAAQAIREQQYVNSFDRAVENSPYKRVDGFKDDCQAWVIRQMESDLQGGKQARDPGTLVREFEKRQGQFNDAGNAAREAAKAATAPRGSPTMPPGLPAGMSRREALSTVRKAMVADMAANQK